MGQSDQQSQTESADQVWVCGHFSTLCVLWNVSGYSSGPEESQGVNKDVRKGEKLPILGGAVLGRANPSKKCVLMTALPQAWQPEYSDPAFAGSFQFVRWFSDWRV
jgi:hypothetical protein